MAFAASARPYTTSIVAESNFMPRSVPKCAYNEVILEPEYAVARISEKMPVMLPDYYCLMTTGESLFNAFDRMEVTAMTAASILTAQIGVLLSCSTNRRYSICGTRFIWNSIVSLRQAGGGGFLTAFFVC